MSAEQEALRIARDEIARLQDRTRQAEEEAQRAKWDRDTKHAEHIEALEREGELRMAVRTLRELLKAEVEEPCPCDWCTKVTKALADTAKWEQQS